MAPAQACDDDGPCREVQVRQPTDLPGANPELPAAIPDVSTIDRDVAHSIRVPETSSGKEDPRVDPAVVSALFRTNLLQTKSGSFVGLGTTLRIEIDRSFALDIGLDVFTGPSTNDQRELRTKRTELSDSVMLSALWGEDIFHFRAGVGAFFSFGMTSAPTRTPSGRVTFEDATLLYAGAVGALGVDSQLGKRWELNAEVRGFFRGNVSGSEEINIGGTHSWSSTGVILSCGFGYRL